MIKKVKGGYTVLSKTGKRLSKPTTKKQAQKRLKEIEFFKRKNK